MFNFQRQIAAYWLFLLAACYHPPLVQTPTLVWQAANQGLTPHASVTTIAISPTANQLLFAGVYGADSLYASSDGGATWQQSGDGIAGQPLFTLLVDPRQDDLLWAGTADGIMDPRIWTVKRAKIKS